MIDKGKYASHGAYIKKINQNWLGRWDKPKSAIITPLPTAKPRQKPLNQQQQHMQVSSRTFNAKFRFQEPVIIKPIPEDLIQPFLYIQKVKNKAKPKKDNKTEPQRKVAKQEKVLKSQKYQQSQKPNIKKDKKQKNTLKPGTVPFVIPLHIRGNKGPTQQALAKPPPGYNNLYEYENDKANTANLLFQKMLESGIDNPVEAFNIWNKNARRNLTNDINIAETEFAQFIKEMIPNKVSNAHIKNFYALYNNQALKNDPNRTEKTDKVHQKPSQISIKAFSYNYLKYKRAETQITNILSEKAAKNRYARLKREIQDYLKQYPELKVGMKAVKEYEDTMRKHFQRLYSGYKNPFQEEINHLKSELEKPIIKYDKQKKQNLQKQVQKYELQNAQMHQNLTNDYNRFMQAYEGAIVKNHDLFFTKRTVAHLLWPIFNHQPLITRDLIERQVAIRQEQKQKYLNCLSEIIVEIDNDKKNINENNFTLGEIVQLINMKFRHKRTKADEQQQALTVQSLKKLIKQIKRQFLVKFNLISDDPHSFPGDQQIPMEILHTCFQMECTKVLFKNRIWTELLEMLPTRSVESKLHQKTIDANTCMEYLIKYFSKLDQRSTLELNKSKQISLLVENAYNQNFGKYADIIQTVVRNLDNYVEGAEADKNEGLLLKPKKKVGFADVTDSLLAVNRGEKSMLQPESDDVVIANNIIKLIHEGAKGTDTNTSNIMNNLLQTNKSGWVGPPQIKDQTDDSPYKAVENLQMLKSMARSYFEPEAMNTNAFDIRFYQKMAEQQKVNKIPEQQMVQLGTSMLLLGAPRPEQIQGASNDPLRISRFLRKTIDKDVKQQQKTVQNKQYESGIYDGVSNNYYREKIKLENRPTRYDSQGKSKYSVLLPVGYYESYIVGQNVPDQQKWYLRPHHVETLTENPLSKKDNVIHTEYQSKLQKLGLKKRPDQFVIQANVQRKQDLISQLQQRIQALKGQVNRARRQKDIPGHKVSPNVVDQYYRNIAEGKQDKDLQLAAYEGVLYDLRRKERSLLNQYRSGEQTQKGTPHDKWWEKKDKQFSRELRKDRTLTVDQSGVHKSYVQKLKNSEIY